MARWLRVASALAMLSVIAIAVLSSSGVTAVSDGDIRLVNGTFSFNGRVEVFFNGEWGTVCDDEWDLPDATAACRQLGFQRASKVWQKAHFGKGTGRIWMDDLRCVGTEKRLADCVFDGVGLHECDHGEDASMECSDVRLTVDGSNTISGRVEIYHNNVWGTVCSAGSNFSMKDASVVCQQLNYDSPTSVANVPYSCTGNSPCYRAGKGKVWLSGVQCAGSEDSLRDCPSSGWTAVDQRCSSHHYDVGVACSFAHVQLDSQLTDVSSGDWSVDVMVVHQGASRRIIDPFNKWSWSDARVVCLNHNLGYPVAWGVHTASSGKALPAALSYLDCYGNEKSLLDCMVFGGWCESLPQCAATTQNVYARCAPVQIRGANDYTGVLSMRQGVAGSQFKTVCGDSWSSTEHRVVCGQLGFSPPQSSPTKLPIMLHGDTVDQYWKVTCQGTENSILQCPYSLVDHCSSKAQVACAPPLVRLTNVTRGKFSGRVEVYFSGRWGSVCDDRWDHRDAQVVCRQLDFGVPTMWPGYGYFGPAPVNGTFWMDEVTCNGSESYLGDCLHHGWGRHNCARKDAAGVTCSRAVLIGGSTPRSGIAEFAKVVDKGGNTPLSTWYQVCADNFAVKTANLLCAEMGFEQASSWSKVTPKYKEHDWIRLDCPSSSSTVDECTFVENATCKSNLHVQITCGVPDVRLQPAPTDGAVVLNGAVEVQHNGVWGVVCGSYWDLSDANVLCRQLGLGKAQLAGSVGLKLTSSSKQTWMNSMHCSGSEQYLSDCGYQGWGKLPWCFSQATVTCAPAPKKKSSSSNGVVIGVSIALVLILLVVALFVWRVCRKVGPSRFRRDSVQAYTGLATDEEFDDEDDDLLGDD